MNQYRLKFLLLKYLKNSISKLELTELIEILRTREDESLDKVIDTLISENNINLDSLKRNFNKELVLENALQQIKAEKNKKIQKEKTIKWVTLAASIVLISCIGFYWNYNYDQKSDYVELEEHFEILLPNENDAIVTLKDGRSYSILDASELTLEEVGIKLIRSSTGDITFKVNQAENVKNDQYTFHSPKGTSSNLILSDGTKVWLNSGSSITYPSQFAADIRQVGIKGEAYFEVAHLAKKPFVVSAGKTRIKVLGTDFNIATNIGQTKIYTTLVSGSVEVKTEQSVSLLEPGMQASSDEGSGLIHTYDVDVQDIIAWKEGYFRFKDDDIKLVLEKIKTWYDIKDYEIKAFTNDRFSGSILRTRKLSDLLNQLEKVSNYKLKIEDGRVLVMK